MKKTLEQFKRERDEALLSLDESRIREFFHAWNGVEMPRTSNLFWGAVHKAITGNTGLPLEFRGRSKAWLQDRGLRSFDDGDVPVVRDAAVTGVKS